MRFAHDTEVALDAAAALVNSSHAEPDTLASPADLARFMATWRWSGTAPRDRASLAAVQRLRPRLERLWHLDEQGAVDLVNEILREAPTLPRLVRHDEWEWHLHAVSDDAPLADRMAVEAAMAMVDVLRMDEFERLQVCAADDCEDVYVDLSKNRSRRFCSTRCSNRTNTAAFRERARES